MATTTSYNSWQQGKKLYLLLWFCAILAIIVILGGNYTSKFVPKNLFSNSEIIVSEANEQTINDLLLSASELNIADKKSFINLYLKSEGIAGVPVVDKIERDKVYKQIFIKKIDNLKAKKGDEVFSVKPIPK